MADLLPSSSDVSGPVGDGPRVVGIDSDDAEDLLAALSSETARNILASLHEEPASPARIAERVDTTLQNAQYHLERMEEAGAIRVADTVYSEKGREMDVYAPADRALVVVAGKEDDTAGLRSVLSNLLGGVGVLGLASLVVDRLLRAGGPLGYAIRSGGSDGGSPAVSTNATVAETAASGGAAETTTAAPTTVQATRTTAEATRTTAEATRTVTEAARTTAEPTATQTVAQTTAAQTATHTTAQAANAPAPLDAIAHSPGTLFFLGGLTILLVWAVWAAQR